MQYGVYFTKVKFMFKILTGIILALIAVAVFLYYRGISPWPPAEISFRDSRIPFHSGKVMIIKNTSDSAHITGSFVVRSRRKKELFTGSIDLPPGESSETGKLEGWSFSTGEHVTVDIKGYILPRTANVP